MAETSALVPVQFHGASLFVTTINGAPHVAMRPIVEAIGLDWKAQYSRIQRHAVLKTCVVITTTQMPGDDQAREVVCLPLDKLNGWLFGVSVSRVRPELRQKLTQYQAECFDVLARHFGAATQPPVAAPQSPTISIDTLIALITGGLIDHAALLRIADASGMALYIDVCDVKDKGWGEAVAAQIDETLPQADLRAIVNKSVQQLWMRSLKAAKVDRPVPQRAQYAVQGLRASGQQVAAV